MYEGLLPIGSVVLLKESTRKVMIIGVLQKKLDADGEKVYDYVGCLYPHGHMSPDKNFLFDNEQIEKLYFIGYQDEEQLEFKVKAEALRQQIRNGEADN